MMPRIERNDGPSGTATRIRSVSTQTTSAAQTPAPTTSMNKVRKTGLRGKSKRTPSQFLGS